MAADGRVEAQVDALYALPLAEFTGARKRLADELKKGGDAAAASTVKSLTKPTLAAWVTNQTVRRAPALLHRLNEVTDQLATAQRALGPAERQQDFQEALADQRQVIGELLDVARSVVAEREQPAGDAVMDAVEKNIRWGPISDEARTSFTMGRLTGDVPPPGFGALLGTPLQLAKPKQKKDEPKDHPKAGRDHRGHPAAVRAAEPSLKSHDGKDDGQNARTRERERTRAAAEARKARQAQLVALNTAWRQARGETSHARRAVERTERSRAEAQARVDEAEKRLASARTILSSAVQSHQQALDVLTARETTEGDVRSRLTAAEGATGD